MSTIYDYVTVALFALLAVLYLHRSSRAEADRIPIWAYALAALACAAANAAGNSGYAVASALLQLCVAAFLVRLALISRR